jgi:thiamine biosynthesis lipoprotein
MREGKEGLLRYQHRAMATVFEVMIVDEDPAFAAGAALAAFEEIDRLEQDLSRYSANSDIARINNLLPNGSVQVGLETFQCLRLSRQYWEETAGAFDVTLGALMNCWVAKDKSLLHPSPEEIGRARERSGMACLELDETTMTVRVHGSVPLIDLGAIGKGYAVDRAAELLREWGVASALVHGGTSSAYAFRDGPQNQGWPITLSNPDVPMEILDTVLLKSEGLGGSGIKKGRHIIDPRSCLPVERRRAAWVLSDSATKSDALSTACMVMSAEEIEKYAASDPKLWAMIVEGRPGTVLRFGRAAASAAHV